jgi:hypothetical protein
MMHALLFVSSILLLCLGSHTSCEAFSPVYHAGAKLGLKPSVSTKHSFDLNLPTNSRLAESKSSSSEAIATEEPSWAFNPLYAFFWLSFFGFAAVGPGEMGSTADRDIAMAIINAPGDPSVSQAFQAIFNYLGIMPIIIACLAVPQASKRGLPPLPFLVASFAMGYGSIGK